MRIVSALGAVALALVAGACGADGGLSAQELAQRANAICTRYSERYDAVARPAMAGAAAEYFAKITPLAEGQVAELMRLDPAGDVKADWDAFVAKQREATDLVRTIARKARTTSRRGLRADLLRFRTIVSQAGTTAAKVGARSCGSS